jgi:hypothetical protein
MKETRRMALLEWARPRRWSILGEAVLAAAVALAAWPILAVAHAAPEPVQVVTDYLEALREGDVERAETFIADADRPDADRSWLTAEAMSDDWEIASVELRSASETTVHAVITAGGARTEGAFQLEQTDDDFRIANPYLYLTGTSTLFAALEIGGVRGEVQAVDGAPLPVALYPGFYPLFADAPDLAGDDGLPLLLLPGSEGGPYALDGVDLDAAMTDALTGSDALEARLNADLAAWLDTCADSADLAPAGCPFSAAAYGGAYDGRTEFETVSDVHWTVQAYPTVRFGRDLRLETVEPGWMTLGGNGIPLFEDTERALDGRCGVDIANLAPALGEDGRITFALAADQGNTCY